MWPSQFEVNGARAVIAATDTGVLLLAIYYDSTIDGLAEMWIKKHDIFMPCH